MKCPAVDGQLFSFVLLLNRLGLGGLFIRQGLVKIIPDGVSSFVAGQYAKSTPAWLPEWFAKPYGYALPWLELIAGVMMVLGLLGRWAASVIFLLILSIIIAKTENWQRFFGERLVVLTLSVIFMAVGSGCFSIDRFLCKSCKINIGGKG